MPKTTATDVGEIDIFARGDLASKLKAATTKTASAATEPVSAPEPPPAVTTQAEPVKRPQAKPAAVQRPKRTSAKVTKFEPSENVPLRFRIPTELKGDWSNFVGELSSALGGVSLDDSNLGRPLIELLLVDYRERILAHAAEKKGTLKRPALSDRLAMAEFDEEIGQVLKGALSTKRKRTVAAE